MSNHFTGLSLGPPLGDQRLDLCDLYAFQSPVDKNRTVIILNANPNADALHPDAIYRLNIDNDGDYLGGRRAICFGAGQDRQLPDAGAADTGTRRSPGDAGLAIVSSRELDKQSGAVGAGRRCSRISNGAHKAGNCLG